MIVEFCNYTKGQQINYSYIDSLSYQQYLKGQWDSLIQTGQLAAKAGIVYPNLSMRMGYAALMKGNNSLSLKYYHKSLEFNSFNQDALYYVALNNALLSRSELASFRTKNIDELVKKKLGLGYKKTVESIDFESSIKTTNTEVRKTGQYHRIGIANRINYRWKLYHNLAFYKQDQLAIIYNTYGNPPRNSNGPVSFRTYLVSDFQYYFKSSYVLNSNFSLSNAFHYVNTHFDNSKYNTSIFNCGLKYYTPYADFKAEINIGPMLDSLITQFAVSSTYFPIGNLNFYGNSRLSYQKRTNLSQLNFSQQIGLRLNSKLWFEAQGTFGKIKNLIDNEALYLYDAIDPSEYRIGGSLLYPVNTHFTLLTNYYYERKTLYLQNTNYNLHSFTIGLSWKH